MINECFKNYLYVYYVKIAFDIPFNEKMQQLLF